MVKDAEASAEDDKNKRAKIDLKNKADLLCYQTEKQIKELESKIENSKKVELENLIKELRTVVQEDNFDLISEKTAALEKMVSELGQSLYQTQGGNDTPNTQSKDEEVIDTDFSEE